MICQQGTSLSQGAAALLRDQGVPAEVLEGGFEAWRQARLPLVPFAKLPPVDPRGRTVWVTRARPKIDRIACPWLIRRFVDPRAVFLFVASVGCRGSGRALWRRSIRHRGCLLEPSGRHLHVRHHGRGVRIRHRAPASPSDHRSRCGHRAAGAFARGSRLARGVLGLSRMYADDLQQLEAGMLLYDAFYRWCRDATDETHNWPTNKPRA